MPEIEYIDRDVCDQIGSVLQKEMQFLLRNYNLNVERLRSTYSDTNIQMKFEISLVNKEGKVLDKTVSDFPYVAGRFGLEANDLGRSFRFKSKNYKITGINTKAHRYPICTICTDNGKKLKFAADTVRVALYGKKEYNVKQVN